MKNWIFKLIKMGVIAGCIVLLVVLSINIRVVTLANKYKHSVDEMPKTDVALVLGALVHKDGTPSKILADRLDFSIDLYKKDKVSKILVSGDNSRKEYNEVIAMKKYIVDKGVNEDDVYMDYAGFSTYDSVYRAKEIFGIKNMVVVTQDYHLSRGVYIARKLGIDAYGTSSDKHHYPKLIIYKIREALARCKDFVFVNIDKKPVCLGEKIEIRMN